MFETAAALWGAITASAWTVALTVSVVAALVAATAYGAYAYATKSRAEAPAMSHVQDLSDIA